MNRARHLSTWAKLGYLARGIVYLIIGWLAFDSNRPIGAGDAVKSVEAMPLGSLLLVLLALGLFGYGLYKVVAGVANLDREDGKKGGVKRAARIASGLGYFLLAVIAVRAMMGLGGGSGSGGQAGGSDGAAAGAARDVAQAPGGDLLLILAGLVILGVAAAQLVIAYKAKFMVEMDPRSPPLVKPAGQAGYAARGIVIAIVGWFALKAGLGGERLRDFGDALAVVRDDQPLLFKLIAAGLLLFGIVSVLMARYRHVRDADLGAFAHEAASHRP